MTTKFRVRYVHEGPGHTGNILWKGEYPAWAGKFPPKHPAAPGSKLFGVVEEGRPFGSDQYGTSEALNKFRSLGYWASCFPEGDGITMRCLAGQDAEQVRRDIAEVFGWEVAP